MTVAELEDLLWRAQQAQRVPLAFDWPVALAAVCRQALAQAREIEALRAGGVEGLPVSVEKKGQPQ